MAEHERRYVLGVDLGTTSVKVRIIDARTHEKLQQHGQTTKANLDVGDGRDEQCPQKILDALQYCLSAIERKYLENVHRIGVCGQMHGVVMWKRDAWSYDLAGERFVLHKGTGTISTLITWQDQRCSEEFLRTLPETSSPSFSKPHSGFGCASMLWLLKTGRLDQEFECAGTIQDLVVAMLTGRERPLMTAHNAASFGYFDPATNRWDLEALATTGFPCYLLPELTEACENSQQIAGRLKYFWFGIPARTEVFAATGDTQCSVLSGLRGQKQAALLHLGTSAQMSFVVDQPESQPKGQYTFFPYFNGKYLCIAASLNGGNVLSHFVSTVRSWLFDLGVSLPEADIWDRLLDPAVLASSSSLSRSSASSAPRTSPPPPLPSPPATSRPATSPPPPTPLASDESIETEAPQRPPSSTALGLRVLPRLFGERHDPEARGCVTGLGPSRPSLDDIFRAFCAGLVDNLIDMLPLETLRRHSIKAVVCAGKVINVNSVLRDEVTRLFADFDVIFGNECDSAFGAALAVSQSLDDV